MFELAKRYAAEGMPAYVRLQEREFELEDLGYTATRHQAEVGTGYFDRVSSTISGGASSTLALEGSTEAAQFRRRGEDGRASEERPNDRLAATGT
jgi:isocitrate lyase